MNKIPSLKEIVDEIEKVMSHYPKKCNSCHKTNCKNCLRKQKLNRIFKI